MLDDGVKAAGVEDDQVKVADLAIHLLDAIEAGESAFEHPAAPLNAPLETPLRVPGPTASSSAATSSPTADGDASFA
jgi:hypothetical protein